MTANRSMIGARIVTQWIGILLAGWLALGTAWAEPVSWYVVTNGVATSDGTTWATAYTNVQDALDNVTPGVTNTIHLAGHTFDMTNTLSWADQTNVTVRGGYDAATGNHDPDNQITILRQTASGERVMLMDGLMDCRLEQVTLTGGHTLNDANADGGGVRAVDSVVALADCVISNNVAQKSETGWSPRGGGLFVSGGAVELLRCRVEGNRAYMSGWTASASGGGLYLDSGRLLVENSRIVGNLSDAGAKGNTYAYSAGVGHTASSALTLRNCLVYANTNTSSYGDSNSRYGAGVVLAAGGLIENCTVAGNRMYNEADTGAGLYLNGGAVSNTIVWGNWRGGATNDVGFGSSASEAGNAFYSCASELTQTEAPNHNLADDPLFLDVAAGDFRLQHDSTRSSPAINAGINQPWMLDATDLAGLPRILMGTVDMGCYEIPPPGGTLFLIR